MSEGVFFKPVDVPRRKIEELTELLEFKNDTLCTIVAIDLACRMVRDGEVMLVVRKNGGVSTHSLEPV